MPCPARSLDTAPAELEQHRLGLWSARNAQRDNSARAAASLLVRVDAAAGVANSKVLETGVDGVGNARRLGVGTPGRSRAASSRVSSGITGAAARRRPGASDPDAD